MLSSSGSPPERAWASSRAWPQWPRWPGVPHEELADVGQLHAPCRPVEEPGAELGFEAADGLGQRRLGQADAVRRLGQVADPRDGEESGELAVHVIPEVIALRSNIDFSRRWEGARLPATWGVGGQSVRARRRENLPGCRTESEEPHDNDDPPGDARRSRAASRSGAGGAESFLDVGDQEPISILINASPWYAGFESVVGLYVEQTGNKVSIDATPYNGVLEKARNAVRTAESAYDILNLDRAGTSSSTSRTCSVRSTRSRRATHAARGRHLRRQLLLERREAASARTSGGKLMAIPPNCNAHVWSTASDLVKTVPATYDELLTTCEALQEPAASSTASPPAASAARGSATTSRPYPAELRRQVGGRRRERRLYRHHQQPGGARRRSRSIVAVHEDVRARTTSARWGRAT